MFQKSLLNAFFNILRYTENYLNNQYKNEYINNTCIFVVAIGKLNASTGFLVIK